jgi:hypothetical protein
MGTMWSGSDSVRILHTGRRLLSSYFCGGRFVIAEQLKMSAAIAIYHLLTDSGGEKGPRLARLRTY